MASLMYEQFLMTIMTERFRRPPWDRRPALGNQLQKMTRRRRRRRRTWRRRGRRRKRRRGRRMMTREGRLLITGEDIWYQMQPIIELSIFTTTQIVEWWWVKVYHHQPWYPCHHNGQGGEGACQGGGGGGGGRDLGQQAHLHTCHRWVSSTLIPAIVGLIFKGNFTMKINFPK